MVTELGITWEAKIIDDGGPFWELKGDFWGCLVFFGLFMGVFRFLVMCLLKIAQY